MRIAISLAAIALLCVAGYFGYCAMMTRAVELPDFTPPYPYAPEVTERLNADARQTLAFVSLVDRLPKGKSQPPTRALSGEAKKRWDDLDRELVADQGYRAKMLRAFHEQTRAFFVESPGEGAFRRMESPDELILDTHDPRRGPRDQLGQPADFPASPGQPLARIEPTGEMYAYHRNGLYDFLYPRGFGYVKDREHVSGFRSHGFRSDPFPAQSGDHGRWRVQHVLLVGILTQKSPLVYLTDQMPSMEQVRQSKTRSLDIFEEAALSSLRDGEDLFLAVEGEMMRMLGAVRATKTCQQCHDADVGDLLGAFSSTLRRAPGKQ